MTPYNLHVGDWVYVKNKCFWPIKIASMDDYEIATIDGDLYDFEELEPIYLSTKTISEFSLPCNGMDIKGKVGENYLFCVFDQNGGKWEFLANSVNSLQKQYYDITGQHLMLKWSGANL
jgi:hypothetical protein